MSFGDELGRRTECMWGGGYWLQEGRGIQAGEKTLYEGATQIIDHVALSH